MKTKFLNSLTVALLLTSCASGPLPKESIEQLNSSALYDPPSVTLIPGNTYQFAEGQLQGRGQRFHSHYRYLRAITIGK